jgi:hypothetical protein
MSEFGVDRNNALMTYSETSRDEVLNSLSHQLHHLLQADAQRKTAEQPVGQAMLR